MANFGPLTAEIC